MNCLLAGVYLDFNSKENADKVAVSTMQPRNRKLTRELNHSVDLQTPEIARRYSVTLRELIEECLLRESLSRPSSIEIVKRTREGLELALKTAHQANENAKAKSMSSVPCAALEPAEPPPASEMERFEGEWEFPQFGADGATPPLTRGASVASFANSVRESFSSLSLGPFGRSAGTPPASDSSWLGSIGLGSSKTPPRPGAGNPEPDNLDEWEGNDFM